MDGKQRRGSRYKMLVKMVTSSLIRRKSRMVVALLAVAIGGTILSGLMTIYYDIPRQMGKEFRSYGANMILLPGNKKRGINQEELKALKDVVKGYDLEGMTPFSYKNLKANGQPIVVAGTDFKEAKGTRPFWYIEGRLPIDKGEILVGSEIAKLLYLQRGKTIELESKNSAGKYIAHPFTVSGIVKSGKSEDGMVFIELDKLREIVGEENLIDVAEISISASKEKLNAIIKNFDDTGMVKARLVKRIANSENTVLSKLQALVWLVSIIVLILTMISVGTTMMAAVVERREEIGLKKAIGAPNKSIIFEFLVEGLLLGTMGGVAGIFLGFLFAHEVSLTVFGRGISIDFTIATATVLMSIIITGVASLIPVRRVVDIEPAHVLKGE